MTTVFEMTIRGLFSQRGPYLPSKIGLKGPHCTGKLGPGGPIVPGGWCRAAPFYREDGAGRPHCTGMMGPGAPFYQEDGAGVPNEGGDLKLYDTVQSSAVVNHAHEHVNIQEYMEHLRAYTEHFRAYTDLRNQGATNTG